MKENGSPLDSKYMPLAARLLTFATSSTNRPKTLTDKELDEIKAYHSDHYEDDDMGSEEYFARCPHHDKEKNDYESFISSVRSMFDEISGASDGDISKIIGGTWINYWIGEGFPHTSELVGICHSLEKYLKDQNIDFKAQKIDESINVTDAYNYYNDFAYAILAQFSDRIKKYVGLDIEGVLDMCGSKSVDGEEVMNYPNHFDKSIGRFYEEGKTIAEAVDYFLPGIKSLVNGQASAM